MMVRESDACKHFEIDTPTIQHLKEFEHHCFGPFPLHFCPLSPFKHLTLGTIYCWGNLTTYVTSHLRKWVAALLPRLPYRCCSSLRPLASCVHEFCCLTLFPFTLKKNHSHRHDPSITSTHTLTVFAIGAVGQGFTMLPSGFIERRVGPRATALVGILIMVSLPFYVLNLGGVV